MSKGDLIRDAFKAVATAEEWQLVRSCQSADFDVTKALEELEDKVIGRLILVYKRHEKIVPEVRERPPNKSLADWKKHIAKIKNDNCPPQLRDWCSSAGTKMVIATLDNLCTKIKRAGKGDNIRVHLKNTPTDEEFSNLPTRPAHLVRSTIPQKRQQTNKRPRTHG